MFTLRSARDVRRHAPAIRAWVKKVLEAWNTDVIAPPPSSRDYYELMRRFSETVERGESPDMVECLRAADAMREDMRRGWVKR